LTVRFRTISPLFCAACLFGGLAVAQTNGQQAPGTLVMQDPGSIPDPGADDAGAPIGVLAGHPTVVAKRSAQPPRVDGNLDDAVWQTAVKITEFVQQRPLDGAPAT